MSTSEGLEPAVLSGELGALRCSVLRYEFDRPDHGLDWLVARISWQGKTVAVDQVGPNVEAHELRQWADHLRRIAEDLADGRKDFIFIEPNFVMACEKSSPLGRFRITLEIHGEPAMRGEHFSVEFEVDQSELCGFAAALGAWSDRFPNRGEAPIDPIF